MTGAEITANLHEMTEQFKRNRLAEATSPYLQQHKDNPVHWQPWEQAAFDEARRRNVPVLLSVGYAACHWCHVMAHECFEDDEVAALMNAHFVCIKLDREERPDLDEIYMSSLAMMGEQGGWPLTACLDHDKTPFWGGTYFPKHPQHGRPGLMQILPEISRIWTEAPDKIAKNTAALGKALKAQAEADARGAMPADLPQRAAASLAAHIDAETGGLSGAPKFPQPFLYRFLWQQAQLTGNAEMAGAVEATLRHILQGGIYDHIGGGLCRYSVDGEWLVPHFEKMLYDNALLLTLICDVWRSTRDPLLQARAEETVAWLAREMTLDSGAFAASLDADSEGEEGLFYVWTVSEVTEVLGDAATAFNAAYDITATGNFEGRNIPHPAFDNTAAQDGFAEARAALLARRETRMRPGRDDKLLADWNGMMIAALAEAAGLFARPDWLAVAEAAYAGAVAALTDESGRLCHSARAGRRLDMVLSSDAAFIGQAATSLYMATGKPGYLAAARDHAETLHNVFHDAARGGYLAAPHASTDAPVNLRPVHDQAMPSANAAALALFADLSVLDGSPVWRSRAEDLFQALAGHLAKSYPSMTGFLSGRLALDHPLSIILVGDADDARTGALLRAARCHPIFARHIVPLAGPDTLPADHPAHGKTAIDGRPTAYLCPDKSCLPPITDADSLTQALDALQAQRHI